jgi:CelD/BcsL family acetyltransferase involved in cellulose biosynthesis
VIGDLEISVVRDQAGLDLLAADWAELYAACPAATPFQSHAWLAAWARAYVRPGRLMVLVVRSSGDLVAIAPLHLTRRGPWPVLALLGGDISDFLDVLVPRGRREVWPALTAALLAEPGWRVLDVARVRPEAAAWEGEATWPGQVTSLEAAVSLELPGVPLPELLARVPSRTANVLRRKLRKSDALGIEISTVSKDGVAEAVTALLRLHEEQWRGRGINPEHLSSRFSAHLTEALPRMVAVGQAVLVEYRIDGELLASHVDLLGHQFLGHYLAGISPRLKERIDVSSMIIGQDAALTVAAGLPRYSMLRGQEDYKLRWRAEEVRSGRLLLSRPGSFAARGLPELARVRAGAVRVLNDRAPWVRVLRSRSHRWAGRKRPEAADRQ